VAGLRSRPTLRFAYTLFFAQRHFFPALTWYLAQNTRYVVVSGARRKEEDWDPAENGGFAVIGSHISPRHITSPVLSALPPPPPPLCRYRQQNRARRSACGTRKDDRRTDARHKSTSAASRTTRGSLRILQRRPIHPLPARAQAFPSREEGGTGA
jgi:hypothetical protein